MIKTTKTAMALALAAALSACAPEPGELFEDAQTAFAAADYQAARVSLVSALEAEPDNVEMKVLLARTLIALGNGEGAALQLSKLPEEKRKEPEIALLQAEADVLRGKFGEAIALVEGREDASADRIRALSFIGQDKLAEAAKAFDVGANRDEPDARLFASYARFVLAQDNTRGALQLANRALEIEPDLAEGLLARGAVFQRANDLPKALADYDKALKRQSSNFDARLGKAQVLARMGRSKVAGELAAQLKAEDPESSDVALVEAQIGANEGNWQKVRTILQAHESAIPGNSDAIILYSEALIALDVPGFALNYLLPELERRPNSRAIRALTARAQLGAGEPKQALATIRVLASRPDATRKELEIGVASAKAAGSKETADSFAKRLDVPTPEWVGGELAKADRALRNRQWSEAEKSYQAILKRGGGKNAMVLNNLAYAQEKQGRMDSALKNALAAVKLEPDNASILDTAGWLLVQTGSKERGIEMLTKAARLDPENQTVAQHLSKARAL